MINAFLVIEKQGPTHVYFDLYLQGIVRRFFSSIYTRVPSSDGNKRRERVAIIRRYLEHESGLR